ncbi:hypothetical protein MNBD_GAMMA25-2490, partial [hydrothermal vent metagenome]
MLIDIYIVRLYRHETDEAESNEVMGVVEIAGKEMKQHFTRLDQLPAIINQLSTSEI